MTNTQRLERAHPAVFIAFAGLASFSAYFAMYAFRKPFAAFEHVVGCTSQCWTTGALC